MLTFIKLCKVQVVLGNNSFQFNLLTQQVHFESLMKLAGYTAEQIQDWKSQNNITDGYIDAKEAQLLCIRHRHYVLAERIADMYQEPQNTDKHLEELHKKYVR